MMGSKFDILIVLFAHITRRIVSEILDEGELLMFRPSIICEEEGRRLRRDIHT